MPSIIVTLPTDAHSFRFSYKASLSMDTPTSTTTTSSSSNSSSISDSLSGLSSVLSTLFPPKPTIRLRSLSNASSRSVTPAPSPAPSTPILRLSSLEEEAEVELPPIFGLMPRIVDQLEARDILHLSQAARGCRKLRKSETFQRHLVLNGWDTEALVRRSEMTKDSKGRPWMFLARSAIQKDDILRHYALLPGVDEKKSLLKDKKNSVKRFLRILMDAVTEHDQHNFPKLASLANSLQLSFIQFVTAIPAHHWKARYRKTFIIAAYTNSQPICPGSEEDLERFSETLTFDHTNPQLLLLAARANLLYTYACMSYSKASPHPLQSSHYDGPHLTTNSSTLPGLRQGIERFTCRMEISGFYRKASGGISPMRVAFEPIGLASKLRLPFTDKDLITLNATVSDGDDNPPWEMSGSIDRNTGVGKIKTTSGMVYDIWVTPWGLTGQKIRGEGKHLGYFALHWA